jgi:hypothetical protein
MDKIIGEYYRHKNLYDLIIKIVDNSNGLLLCEIIEDPKNLVIVEIGGGLPTLGLSMLETYYTRLPGYGTPLYKVLHDS